MEWFHHDFSPPPSAREYDDQDHEKDASTHSDEELHASSLCWSATFVVDFAGVYLAKPN